MEFKPLKIELIEQLAQIKAFYVNKTLQIVAAFFDILSKLHDRGKISQITPSAI